MRVHQLTGHSRRSRSERGATAVLAAVLSIMLVGVAAFTVDFGRAYASKRQLQNAADAGALAGASYYVDKAGDCATLAGNATYEAESRAVAEALLQETRPNATIDNYDVTCPGGPTVGELVVLVSLTGSTPVSFGGVYGADTVVTQRQAEATLEVIETAGRGLRPYMVCSEYAPPVNQLPTAFVQVDFPSTSDTSGNCPHDSGNWFTVDCPHAGNSSNGNPDLAVATREGCDPAHPVSIVDPQDHTSPATLYNSLRAACPANANAMANYDPDCLTSNPGNLNANDVLEAWASLVGKSILLPVFCAAGSGADKCNPAGWVEQSSGGNNTMYPVFRFASVKVCGYHWGSNATNQQHSGLYPGTDATDKCFGADATSGGNDNYLLLAFERYQFSGSTSDSSCPLNDPRCDGGGRQVRLTS